jgi:hypothetical protein
MGREGQVGPIVVIEVEEVDAEIAADVRFVVDTFICVSVYFDGAVGSGWIGRLAGGDAGEHRRCDHGGAADRGGADGEASGRDHSSGMKNNHE